MSYRKMFLSTRILFFLFLVFYSSNFSPFYELKTFAISILIEDCHYLVIIETKSLQIYSWKFSNLRVDVSKRELKHFYHYLCKLLVRYLQLHTQTNQSCSSTPFHFCYSLTLVNSPVQLYCPCMRLIQI